MEHALHTAARFARLSPRLRSAASPPRLLCELRSPPRLLRALLAAPAASFARRSLPVLLELSHRPAARACCSRLPLASLSPPRQLLAPLALPSARSARHLSCCSLRVAFCLLRSPPLLLLAPLAALPAALASLAAPPAALGLASLAFSPADAAHPPRSRFALLSGARPLPDRVIRSASSGKEIFVKEVHRNFDPSKSKQSSPPPPPTAARTEFGTSLFLLPVPYLLNPPGELPVGKTAS